jgi:hypothetical protein
MGVKGFDPDTGKLVKQIDQAMIRSDGPRPLLPKPSNDKVLHQFTGKAIALAHRGIPYAFNSCSLMRRDA